MMRTEQCSAEMYDGMMPKFLTPKLAHARSIGQCSPEAGSEIGIDYCQVTAQAHKM